MCSRNSSGIVARRTSAVRQIGQKSRHWNSMPECSAPAFTPSFRSSNGLALSKRKVSSIGRILFLESHHECALLEARLPGPVGGERRRQHDVALVAADTDDQLEADLLQL